MILLPLRMATVVGLLLLEIGLLSLTSIRPVPRFSTIVADTLSQVTGVTVLPRV